MGQFDEARESATDSTRLGRRAYAEGRRLARLAWPVVIGQLGMVLMGAVDLWMVAPLGEAATASVGLGNTYSFGLVIVGLGAATGIDPLVTQAYGAREPRKAGEAALLGLVLVGVLSVPLVAMHLVSTKVLGGLGQPPELLATTDVYCSIQAVGVVPFLAFAVVRQWLQGDGVMRPAAIVIAVANVVNIIANATLIERFGVAGVAWATVIVRWVMLVGLVTLTTRTLRRAWPHRLRLAWAPFARLAALAVPVGGQVALEFWAFGAAAIMAGWLGPTSTAAHVSALNVIAFAFMVANGLSAAAATRVGNLVGAGRPWMLAAAISLLLVTVAMSLTGLAFVALPSLIGRAYSTDAAVVGLIAAVLPIGGAFGLFDGVQVVAFGILRGLGDTRVPSLFNLVGYWALGLPLGAWLVTSTELGLRGIWIGLALSLVVVAGLLLARILWHARDGAGRELSQADPGPIPRERSYKSETAEPGVDSLP